MTTATGDPRIDQKKEAEAETEEAGTFPFV